MNVEGLTIKFISHAEGAKSAELYSLLFTLALERSQLTRDGGRRGGSEGFVSGLYLTQRAQRAQKNDDSLTFNDDG